MSGVRRDPVWGGAPREKDTPATRGMIHKVRHLVEGAD
jgi:hypothetical protein